MAGNIRLAGEFRTAISDKTRYRSTGGVRRLLTTKQGLKNETVIYISLMRGRRRTRHFVDRIGR